MEELKFVFEEIPFRLEVFKPESGRVSGIVVFLHGQGLSLRVYKHIRPQSFTGKDMLFVQFNQRATDGMPGTYTYKGSVRDAYEIEGFVRKHYALPPNVPLFFLAHSCSSLGVFQNFFEAGLKPKAMSSICPVIRSTYFRHNKNFRFRESQETGFDRWMSQLKSDPETLSYLRSFYSDPEWIYHPEWLESRYKKVFKNKRVCWGGLIADDWEQMLHNWYTLPKTEEMAKWETVDWPILTVVGGNDEWLATEEAQELHRKFSNPKNQFFNFADGDHMMAPYWLELSEKCAEFFKQFAI